jgi:cytochrome P450 family 135
MTIAVMATPRGLPPGPSWPLAVQTMRFGLDPYGLFESAHRAFGDVFTLRVMAETWVILAHPDAVRELYGHGPDELDSGAAPQSLRPVLGTQNLLLLDGAEHLRRRNLVLPPFHGERMRAYEELIREATNREIATWPLGALVLTLPRMHAITLRVVLRAVFGVQEGPELDRLGASVRRLMAWTTDPRRGLVFGFLGPDRPMSLGGFRRQLADVDGQLLAEIARRRNPPDLAHRQDILSLLLGARHEDGGALSDRELRDELMTLLVAGHETTAALLSWALTEVARDPQAQARLASGEQGLAEAAITETLRLHPPVPLGSLRRLRHPMTIAGWQLPAGATVASCSLLIHRRPDIYVQPTAWRVDRFLGTRPPSGAWIPFGGGVRRCVGAAFAQFEARTVLDEVTRALELRLARRPSRRVGRRGIVLVPPRGGPVIPAARHASAPTVARINLTRAGGELAGPGELAGRGMSADRKSSSSSPGRPRGRRGLNG